MSQEFYRQCAFKSGNSTTTAWIDETGIEIGCKVSFKGQPDKWWEVISVGSHRITKQQAKALERRNVQFQASIK